MTLNLRLKNKKLFLERVYKGFLIQEKFINSKSIGANIFKRKHWEGWVNWKSMSNESFLIFPIRFIHENLIYLMI